VRGERGISGTIKSALIGVVLAASSIEFATAGLALAHSGKCAPTATQSRTSTLEVSNTGDLEPIIESSITFVQGGSIASCIIVTFSSEAKTDGKTVQAFVQAEIDGTDIGSPGEVSFAAQDTFQARSFTFVFPSVLPGSHIIKMRSERNGDRGTAVFGLRTLIVQHAP
jgi:hypothetical protein